MRILGGDRHGPGDLPLAFILIPTCFYNEVGTLLSEYYYYTIQFHHIYRIILNGALDGFFEYW